MIDPLADILALLRPRVVFTKGISGAGRWGVRYTAFGKASFAVVVEGSCRLAVDGQSELSLEAGDFVLLPTTPGFTMSGSEPVSPAPIDPHAVAIGTGDVRHGRQDGPPDVRLLGGYFDFEGEEAALLGALLPKQIHVRGVERLSTLVSFLIDEAAQAQSGRTLILTRIVEILLIEALRLTPVLDAEAGLLRGLSDPRLAEAIRQMHAAPAHPWTMAELARRAGMSRSAFFDRFLRHVGMPPMEYLLTWRMALASKLLRHDGVGIIDVAERVGYRSGSTFSTAFKRHLGQSPGRYTRSTSGRADAAADSRATERAGDRRLP